MQPNTPRMALRRMNSDGTDLVDLDNQYNVNWDILDESFIPRNVNNGPRPTSSSGIHLYEDNSITDLYSVGPDEWNCFGSKGMLFDRDFTFGGTINSAVDTYMPIGNALIDNRTCTTIDAETIQIIPGWYLLSGQVRFAVNGNGGMYLVFFNSYTTGGVFQSTIQQADLKAAEVASMTLNISTLFRSTTTQRLKMGCYQNSGVGRTLENASGDGSQYSRFQCAYIRPLLQGV